MRFLLLGGTGQVGEEIRARASRDFNVAAPDRESLDLTKPADIARVVSSERWAGVINAAAYTEVDRAETEESLAFAINGQACEILAREAARSEIPLIHVSTDYIFDGRKGTPYVEADAVGPLNVYGRSKLAGERAIVAGNPRHIVLRTSWVYSAHRKNFVKTILRLAGERDRLTIVDDQRGCPTAARDIADTCIALARRAANDSSEIPYGIYHFAGAGDTTWYGFAKAIVELASKELRNVPVVVPIKTSEYPTPAVRPADTRLDCSAIFRAFGIKPRPWRTALTETVAELTANRGVS
jgi:dTDP-4-dehydrorhamnose reductase